MKLINNSKFLSHFSVNTFESICDADLSKTGSNIQGIFINIRW